MILRIINWQYEHKNQKITKLPFYSLHLIHHVPLELNHLISIH